MKKLMTTLVFAGMLLLTSIFTPLQCNHVHTSDCEYNGINCTHCCLEVMPCEDENTPY